MKIVHNEEKTRFNLYNDEGAHVGEIEYKKGGNNELYATHTEVFPGYEGQGYAVQLLDTLVAYAEERGAKIVPICSYVISQFKRNPQKYAAVMKTH